MQFVSPRACRQAPALCGESGSQDFAFLPQSLALVASSGANHWHQRRAIGRVENAKGASQKPEEAIPLQRRV
ncbi:hypothetical protein [Bradyrhizobium sp. AC87j1]|uniref:hypothetical protein n=1 Tax=Bradyrhizobium sp. AC87j1 TaxID=2055894 RepID=UPI0011B06335|nr:hypothetical protein [Bradyrhizobium sp. AC87j1]